MNKLSILLCFAQANVLTGLYGDLYDGLDVVSRELVGFIPSVTRNASAERVAKGQNVTYPIAPSLSAVDITPAMAISEPADVTMGYGQLSITKARAVEFGFAGEEYKALNNGVGALSVQASLFAQGLRTLVNEIEADIAQAAVVGASRAYGTAGTTPFASNIGESAQLKKILDDNGAETSNRALIINTSAGAALRTLGQLSKVNEAGSSMTLRDGMLGDLNTLIVKESGQVKTPTVGTGSGYLVNSASLTVGSTSIPVDTGSGTILAGDIITVAGDSNKYVVKTALAGGVVVIAKPGLRVAPADNSAVTVVAAAARNIAFASSAIHLVTRAPALVGGRDAAIDSMMITDPRSGLSFDVRVYAGDHKLKFTVGAAWGTSVVKTESVAQLLG